MPRATRDSKEPTAWQLRVLVEVANADDWATALHTLGLNEKYQAERIISRVSEKLGFRFPIVEDVGGAPKLANDDLKKLVDEAERVLEGFALLENYGGGVEREYLIRVNAYASHVATFLGSVVREFESENPTARVQLVREFGVERAGAGAGLLTGLKRGGAVDLVISPSQPDGSVKVHVLPAHRWLLVAALDPDHPLAAGRPPARMPISPFELMPHPLLASRHGHETRALLQGLQGPTRRFNIEAEADEPPALVAMASARRVPIIASDSAVILEKARRLPSHWRALGNDDGSTLGGAYYVVWRAEDVPEDLVPMLADLARRLTKASADLDARVVRWLGGKN